MSTTWVSLTPEIAAYFAACRLPRRPAPTTAARISRMSVHREVGGACHREGALALEQQAFSGLDSDHRGTDFHQQLDGRRTDGGAVEAQVLSGFGHFRDDQ